MGNLHIKQICLGRCIIWFHDRGRYPKCQQGSLRDCLHGWVPSVCWIFLVCPHKWGACQWPCYTTPLSFWRFRRHVHMRCLNILKGLQRLPNRHKYNLHHQYSGPNLEFYRYVYSGHFFSLANCLAPILSTPSFCLHTYQHPISACTLINTLFLPAHVSFRSTPPAMETTIKRWIYDYIYTIAGSSVDDAVSKLRAGRPDFTFPTNVTAFPFIVVGTLYLSD